MHENSIDCIEIDPHTTINNETAKSHCEMNIAIVEYDKIAQSRLVCYNYTVKVYVHFSRECVMYKQPYKSILKRRNNL